MGEQDYKFEQTEIPGLTEINFPQRQPKETVGTDKPNLDVKILDSLLHQGEIDRSCYDETIEKIENGMEDIGEYVVANGWCGEKDVLKVKADFFGMEFREVESSQVQRDVFDILGLDYTKENRIIAIGKEDNRLIVATSEPENIFVLEQVKKRIKEKVTAVVCTQKNIDRICEDFKEEENVDYCIDDIMNDMTDVEVVQQEKKDYDDLEKMAEKSPIIKFVNYLISNAIKEAASDIHVEPKPDTVRIRYRIDGVLFEMMQAPLKMHPAIVSRVKIMSNLDISERRLPQDGKISVVVKGRGIDLRISTLPTSNGEKVVIRILDSKSILRGLDSLGMDEALTREFKKQTEMPHGIFLVTGPTGSGKSTTLYTALNQMDGNTLNISTVEDPVEYELGFCNQVQVKEKIGLSFAAALRSLLRQDPDVIMLGEIRDAETAMISTQAALTGHLVLSTLHTNDAPGSITRLVNIGIDSYLIAASLNAVLAQRLVRRVCPKCKEKYQVADNMKKYVEMAGINPDDLYRGTGCDYCRNSGYVGRIGLYELLVMDEHFRDMINKDPSVNNMRKVFRESGGKSLYEDGLDKVKKGLTTIEEVLRVTETDDPEQDASESEK
jgi:type IV pilus assembly protein PilB